MDLNPSRSITCSKYIVKPTCEQSSVIHVLHVGTQSTISTIMSCPKNLSYNFTKISLGKSTYFNTQGGFCSYPTRSNDLQFIQFKNANVPSSKLSHFMAFLTCKLLVLILSLLDIIYLSNLLKETPKYKA
jgi:hypothetical protein